TAAAYDPDPTSEADTMAQSQNPRLRDAFQPTAGFGRSAERVVKNRVLAQGTLRHKVRSRSTSANSGRREPRSMTLESEPDEPAFQHPFYARLPRIRLRVFPCFRRVLPRPQRVGTLDDCNPDGPIPSKRDTMRRWLLAVAVLTVPAIPLGAAPPASSDP